MEAKNTGGDQPCLNLKYLEVSSRNELEGGRGMRLVRGGGGVDVTCTTSPAGDEPLDVVLYVLVL